MRKILLISLLLWSIIFTGCSNTKQADQINNKPDAIKATISWLWWSLSRETSIVGDVKYWIETTPISNEAVKDYLWYYFNSAWDTLIAECNNWYKMTQCEWYSNKDNVVNSDNSLCRLLNDNPDLTRTSMIIECTKN